MVNALGFLFVSSIPELELDKVVTWEHQQTETKKKAPAQACFL